VAARIALLFAFGAVTLSFFDGFHTHSGATSYPSPWLWQMAWWVPLEFGFVTAAGGLFYARAYRGLGGARATSRGAVAVSFALFAAAYWASGYLPVANAAKCAVVGAMFVTGWCVSDRTWQGLVLSGVAAVGGPITEITLSHFGLFAHLRADFWGIPMWLPFLYLASGPAIGQLARIVFEDEPKPTAAAV
jgi:hypothetical protein